MTGFAQRFREESDDTKYYGIEPQAGSRAVMFEMRTKDGNRKAFAYSYLVEADYMPETGILINVSDVVITITGRSLSDIYNYLLSNRLTYVQEDYSGLDDGESSVFIEAIEIKAKFTGQFQNLD